MIGQITILSIFGSTMIVNAAPQIQGLPAFARQEPNCTSNSSSFKPYNPHNLDAQSLNLFYLDFTTQTCDSNSIDPCTRACQSLELATCGGNVWTDTKCSTEGCRAYPDDGNVTVVGCIGLKELSQKFEQHGYRDGPFGPTFPSGVSSLPQSSSMSTRNPLSTTSKVLPPSMSSPASIPSLTSPGGLGRRHSPSPTPNSGMDFTSTSSGELGDPTGGPEMELPTMSCPPMSSHSSSFSTGLHTSMSSDHCAGRPTSLPSSSTSTMLSSMKSPPTPSPLTPMPVENSGLPLPTSSAY